MTVTRNNYLVCRRVDGCPLRTDCNNDGEAAPSLCPMKRWSFDDLLCESPRCPECDSLDQFEITYSEELKRQDRRDLSLYWKDHLNYHLERFTETREARKDLI